MADKEVGDSTILPDNEQAKQGQTYGYPGLRGAGPSGAELEPVARPNGKMKP